MKNNLSYYRHEVNSHNHWKFKTLRRKYKWCGEGKFWALNNMIGEAENCQLNISNADIKASIAADLDFDITEFEQFVEYLIKVCKLLVEEDGLLTTPMTQENLAEVNSKRERQRNWKKQKSTHETEKSTSTEQQSTVENEQNKVKESKVKEIKKEESKEPIFSTPPVEEKFELKLEIELPATTLEAAEINQFTLTRNKNTEHIQAQWNIFLAERIHDPPEKRCQYRQLSDLTTYFLNWVRTKHPKNDSTNRPTVTGNSGKSGTSEARIERAKNWGRK